MNHADRVIAAARQTIRDYRALMTLHSALLERVDEGDRKDWYVDISEQEALVVDQYQSLRIKAGLAQHTLEVYGEEI